MYLPSTYASITRTIHIVSMLASIVNFASPAARRKPGTMNAGTQMKMAEMPWIIATVTASFSASGETL